ncbi:MAG: pirin family protein [Gammaproteobacteria bacterium]
MSNLVAEHEPLSGTDVPSAKPVLEKLPVRETIVGDDMKVRRALPNKLRRLVGAWTFLDHYGPVTISGDGKGMRVGPHPHTGLQTVSWLYQGEVLHRDSLGFKQLIRPGQLNLMTAGNGIAHSEETPFPHSPDIHGLQFWIALPETRRHGEAVFDHYPQLPVLERDGLRLTLVIGEGLGEHSPARVFSPLTGFDVELRDSGMHRLALNPVFEYALLVIDGALNIEDTAAEPTALYYLGCGRERLALTNSNPARAFLFGGAPFGEEVLLWWNFAARTTEEMAAARKDWEAHATRFGEVHGYEGPRLIVPGLSTRLKAR